MCLSKVYEKSAGTEKLLMSNVQRIRVEGGTIIFTDLLENETRVEGTLLTADLVNGRVIFTTEKN